MRNTYFEKLINNICNFLDAFCAFLTFVWIGNLLSKPTNDPRQMNVVQKIATFMTTAIVVVLGMITLAMMRHDHKIGKTAFEQSNPIVVNNTIASNDSFLAIVLFESNGDSCRNLSVIGKAKVVGNPAFVFPNKTGARQLYNANNFVVGNLPPVSFMQKIEFASGSFEEKTFGPFEVYPIYAVFKAPNAIEKVKKWAKENGYNGWDFELKYESGWGELSTHTQTVEFEKPGSRVTLVGYFQGKRMLFLWDGEKTYDCSTRINSNVSGDSKEVSKYVTWLRSVGQ